MKEAELKTHPKVTNVDFKDRNFFSDMENSSSPNHNAVHMALLHLSLCHTTLCELSSNNEFIYNASSPDELALVNYAKYCGYEFQGKDEENYMSVRMPDGHIRKFELLHVLEFNSTRKRMSVIIKDPITNELLLLTKGADSMLHPRLKNQESDLVDKTFSHLEEYANIGLRTLVLAQKVLQPQEYESWLKLYIEASSAIKDREVGVMSLQEDIEKGLELIAATAIEDKLQDQVGITIKSLKKAGINIWVLTGDKLETAINIGYSCKLLSDDQEKIIIDGQEEVEIDQNIQDGFKILANRPKDPPENFCLIITGDALKHAIKDNFSKSLIQLSDRCSTVIACRMSPKQKQEVVSLIKSNKPDVTTLAIGDGANDVNMITAAHVGIGIRGVEGQQAARASDYAIGEFKVLRRLLLNHGREYYRRNSTLICYNFFKNMILVLPQFWFAFYDGFSGVSFYDQYLFQLFNLYYTSLPIFVYSLMDKEYSGTYLTRNPQLYAQGIKGLLFKKRVFWMWMFMGVWQSLLLTYFVMFSLENINLYKNFPYQTNIMITGMIIYGATILNTNVKIILFSNIYTPICMFFIWGSILFFVSNYAIESTFVQDSEVYDTFNLYISMYLYYFHNKHII